MHGGGDSSDFLTGQQSKEVDEMRSDVDRGSATGKHGIKCPACACSFVAVGRTHNETERHVVEIRRNVPLGIFEGGEQVATPEDERYRAVEVGFLGQSSEPGNLRHADPAGLFKRKWNFSCDQRFRDRRHFGMPTERKRKIDSLAIEQLIA